MADNTSVGYVVKGYPRISELFIASEIYRLEQLGVPIRLFVLKASDEQHHHPVVDRIRAVPECAPETSSLRATGLPRWLHGNAKPFLPAVARLATRHPYRFAKAAAAALAQSIRSRRGWRLRPIYVKEFLVACWLADRVFAGGAVDRLHAHFAHGSTTVAWLAAQLLDVPFSFTGHAKDIYRESLNPGGLLARKMRAATTVVTCTGANVEHLRRVAPDARVRLAYHGLNADFSDMVASSMPPVCLPEDRLRIISVGRLVRKKGFDVLVEAVAQLVSGGTDLTPREVTLAIAGEDGDQSDAIRDLVARRGLADRVCFLGPLTQRELLDHYRRSTVFALACRIDADGDRDGIPNVLVEAMAAGLPVVSTRVSGIPELVEDGRTGLLAAPEDPTALAAAIHRVHTDPALGRRMRRAGAARVAADFDGAVLARRMATLLGATK
jgi:glycosyltransferase involved in cell wall biosynthesis